jgi:hypothetical protein
VLWVSFFFALAAVAWQDAPAGNTSEPARPQSHGPLEKPRSAKTETSASAAAPAEKAAPAQKGDRATSGKPAPARAAKTRAAKEAAKAARPKRGTSTDSPVRVQTQSEMRKPRSSFLVMPGEDPADRYAPEWDDLPAWRRASFFGIRARGQFFIYVVDCSGSMIDEDRMPRATIELRRSVFALQEPQRFEVIFFNNESIPMPGGPIPRAADVQAKNLLVSWLRLIEPDGGTAPLPAVKQALALKPDAVFLLSDGAFPDGTVDEVAKLNTHKVPIHCVDLAGGLAGDHLQRIAAASGGRYASKPGDLQARP